MTHSKNQICITHTELFYVGTSSEQDRSFPPPSHGAVGALRATGGCADQKGVMLGGSGLTWTPHGLSWLLTSGSWQREIPAFSGKHNMAVLQLLQQIPPLEVKFT